jgi:uncharacterized membrane protein YqjE
VTMDRTSTSTERFDLDDRNVATQPKRPERSLGELLGEMSSELGTLLRKEVELAKVETREELSKAGKSAGMFGAAGLAGWLAVLFISLAAAWLLDQAINTALSFAIVGVVWAIAAFVLMRIGRRKLSEVNPLPETKETLKEDVEWAKARTK